MIRYKVKNCIDEDRDAILEIEEEFTNTLLNGLNINASFIRVLSSKLVVLLTVC